jgi:hypothetical protein
MSHTHPGELKELRPRKTNHLGDIIFVMLSDDDLDGEWGLGSIRLLFFLFRERLRLLLKLAFTSRDFR